MEFAGWKISLQIPSVEGEKKNRRNRIFGDIFAPPSYSPSGKVVRREEKDKERRGEEKKGAKADGKVWRPSSSPSYRPPNYFRLVNAIFLKARAVYQGCVYSRHI